MNLVDETFSADIHKVKPVGMHELKALNQNIHSLNPFSASGSWHGLIAKSENMAQHRIINFRVDIVNKSYWARSFICAELL